MISQSALRGDLEAHQQQLEELKVGGGVMMFWISVWSAVAHWVVCVCLRSSAVS